MEKDFGDLSPFIPSIDFFDDTLEMTVQYILDIKERFRDVPGKFESFSTDLRNAMEEKKIKCNGDLVGLKETPASVFRAVKGVLRGHVDLLMRFDVYLPLAYDTNHGYVKSSNEVLNRRDRRRRLAAVEIAPKKRKEIGEGDDVDSEKAKKKIRRELCNVLEDKVCEKLSNQTYIDLLEKLYLHGKGLLERRKLESEVENLVGEFPDLVQGLKHCLNRCEALGEQAKTQKQRQTCQKTAQVVHPVDSSKPKLNIWLKRKPRTKLRSMKLESS